ncbi:MAG: hypothetical protein PHD32_02715 [Eubacteriales bacterium]|nr:hypothetical protein [Eubacteriales bacterium]
MKKNEPHSFPVTLGAPSVLAIFLVLCLAVFGVLSLVTTRSENLLARSTASSVLAYYAADAQAQTLLRDLDAAAAAHSAAELPAALAGLSGVSDVNVTDGTLTVSFWIKGQNDFVIKGQAELRENRFQLLSYAYANTNQSGYDTPVNVLE